MIDTPHPSSDGPPPPPYRRWCIQLVSAGVTVAAVAGAWALTGSPWILPFVVLFVMTVMPGVLNQALRA